MREQQQVFNNPDLGSVTDDWDLLGENVGVGGSIDGIMAAFMASSAHKANILNSAFNYIGAGVKEDANGIIWVSVIFMAGPDDLLDPPSTTTTTTPQPPSTKTTTQPPGPTTTTTAPPGPTTTTTAPPGSTTTTTAPPGDGDDTGPPTTVVSIWELQYEEFAVLGPDWLNPALLRLVGSMSR